MSFFKNREQEGKDRSYLGLAPEGGEDRRKGCRKMNMEEISRTHA
jgi:hypothetical protein